MRHQVRFGLALDEPSAVRGCILRLSMFMRLRKGQWTLLVSSCLRSINSVNLRACEHADSQNIWIHPRMSGKGRHGAQRGFTRSMQYRLFHCTNRNAAVRGASSVNVGRWMQGMLVRLTRRCASEPVRTMDRLSWLRRP